MDKNEYSNLYTQEDLLATCSAMKLTSKTGRPYWFRSLDFKTNIWDNQAHLVSFPKDYELPLTGTENKITCTYSMMGMTYNKKDEWLLDGINSEGLLGGLLFLYEGTSAEIAEQGYLGVTGLEILTYFLAKCKNVEEVCKLAENVQVLDIPIRGTQIRATLHYTFLDTNGTVVVLEAADAEHPGRLQIVTKNQIGILTNSPVYEKQLSNLSWFLSQNSELNFGEGGKPVQELQLDQTKIEADVDADHVINNGTFPATYTSYDRFVRLAVLKALNNNGNSISDEQMLPFGMGIFRCVFEPHSKGIYHYVRQSKEGVLEGQGDGFTQYVIMYDLVEKKLSIMPYDTILWTHLSLEDCSKSELEHHDIIRKPR